MKKEITIVVVALLLILGIAYFLNKPQISTPGKYDAFATCLKDSGAIFYGAFWCPHCKAQKALFGGSVSKLPYVECSTPDGQSQTPICIQKGIQSYPTWIFKDGSQLSGEIPLATLASTTSCALPADDQIATTTSVTPGGATIINGATSTNSGKPDGKL